MLVGVLSATALRDTYLRGIDLGAAWSGPSAEAAMDRLIDGQLALAETRMGIHWPRSRIMTAPDPTLVEGQDYDAAAPLIPYVPPRPDATTYDLPLYYHDVQSIARVAIFQGLDEAVPPAPIYVPLDVTQTFLTPRDEHLQVPVGLVTAPDLARGWAVDYVIGLGRIPLEVADWVMLGAAIQVLGLAGAAADVSHGLAAESLRQDGIEESIKYGGQGAAHTSGLYSGPINVLQRMRDAIDLTKLRFKYQGSKYPPYPLHGVV